MAEVSNTVRIDRPVDEVWRVVSDTGDIAAWIPMIASSRMEGDNRIAELEGGGRIVERILRNDDTTRTVEYDIAESPLPLDSYLATLVVEEDGDGAAVTWTMRLEPDNLADLMAPMNRGGLDALKAYLEGGA